MKRTTKSRRTKTRKTKTRKTRGKKIASRDKKYQIKKKYKWGVKIGRDWWLEEVKNGKKEKRVFPSRKAAAEYVARQVDKKVMPNAKAARFEVEFKYE